MKTRDDLLKAVDEARKGDAYRHYLAMRERVLHVEYTVTAMPRPRRSAAHALMSAALRPEDLSLAAKRFVARSIRRRPGGRSVHVYRPLVGARRERVATR